MTKTRRMIVVALAVAAPIMGAVTVPTAVAAPLPPPGLSAASPTGQLVSGLTTKVRGKTVHFCLASNAAGTVRTKPCSNGADEVWAALALPPASAGFIGLINKATGQCLEGTHKTSIRTGGCSTADIAQYWNTFGTDAGQPGPVGFGQLYNGYNAFDWALATTKPGPPNPDLAVGARV